MYDIYAFPKFNTDKIEHIMTHISKDMIKTYFDKYGHMTRKKSGLTQRYKHIHEDIHHIGITKTHIYLIVPYAHNNHEPHIF